MVRSRFFIILLLFVQLIVFIGALTMQGTGSKAVHGFLSLISLLVCIHIISGNGKTAFKLLWVFVILLFPLFGGLFYLIFNYQITPKRYLSRENKKKSRARAEYTPSEEAFEKACADHRERKNQIIYLQKNSGFPVFANTETEYYPSGEAFFEALKEELKKAEKYIFLEYFIIQEGVMWNSILDILKEKAASGVTVKLLYDDLGCFLLLPKDYPKRLEEWGIECRIFNPFRPIFTTLQNNRDHRKIAVIDGVTAFTGGINLADEYINRFEKHGHWKDSAIRLTGDGAYGMAEMFVQLWNEVVSKGSVVSELEPPKSFSCSGNGYVQPYCDSPLDKESVGEEVYLQMINNAKDYLYITTPYLIVDEPLLKALKLSAKSGVDVRIITPKIWDKRAVHMTTRSFYGELTAAGIKVYEYTRGFMHSKTFVSDDSAATVGTVNLDYRSLYHHFECGVCLYGTESVLSVKADFLETLKECELITADQCKYGFFTRIKQSILRLFAPIM